MKPPKNKRVICKDGFSFSVQAHEGGYCTPKEDNAESYTEVEIGFPDAEEYVLKPYCEDPTDPTGTVYGYVPIDLVRHLIDKHGGIEEGEVPKGTPVYGRDWSRDYDADLVTDVFGNAF